MKKRELLLGTLLPLILLAINIWWFFSQHPYIAKEYTGYINMGAGNLHLLTKEIVDFRALLFLFLILIPSILISIIIATLIIRFNQKTLDNKSGVLKFLN